MCRGTHVTVLGREELPSFNSGEITHTFNFQAFLHPKGEEEKLSKEMVVKLTKLIHKQR